MVKRAETGAPDRDPRSRLSAGGDRRYPGARLGPMNVGSRLLERVRLRMDDGRRVKLTQYGNLAIEGDLASAVEGLGRVERDAFSVAVRGWAIAGEGFVLLAGGRMAEAEAALARHPDPASQPLLALTITVARGRIDPEFANALSTCTEAIPAMGVARVLVDGGHVDKVVRQSLDQPRGRGSLALLALQLGLHAAREHEAAIRVGELLWDRQHWDIQGYWMAVSFAELGDVATAIAWLNRAADRGFSGRAAIDRELRFDPYRQLPEFIEARARVAGNPRRAGDVTQARLPWSGAP